MNPCCACARLLVGLAASAILLSLAACDSKPVGPVSPDKDSEASSGPQFWDPIRPCSSTAEPIAIHDDYWRGQFERVNAEVASAEDCRLIFFGDSITMDWTLLRGHGKEPWEEHFAKYNPINMGNSGDITPVMLYRCAHGNLDFAEGQAPRVAVLLCGTNNYVVTKSARGAVQWQLGIDTPPAEVAEGVRAVAQAFSRELPSTRVIVLGILPVNNQKKQPKVAETNRILASYHYPQDEVIFMDLQEHFMNVDGSLKQGLYTDGTHLTPEGYVVLADVLRPEIERLMALGPLE